MNNIVQQCASYLIIKIYLHVVNVNGIELRLAEPHSMVFMNSCVDVLVQSGCDYLNAHKDNIYSNSKRTALNSN